jgi:hypothetical protein
MNKNVLPWQILTLVALVVPSVYLLLLWPSLPAQIPSHFAADGQPNGYTSRANMWLLTLALPLEGVFKKNSYLHLFMTRFPYPTDVTDAEWLILSVCSKLIVQSERHAELAEASLPLRQGRSTKR